LFRLQNLWRQGYSVGTEVAAEKVGFVKGTDLSVP
jgi:hypothetical protein